MVDSAEGSQFFPPHAGRRVHWATRLSGQMQQTGRYTNTINHSINLYLHCHNYNQISLRACVYCLPVVYLPRRKGSSIRADSGLNTLAERKKSATAGRSVAYIFCYPLFHQLVLFLLGAVNKSYTLFGVRARAIKGIIIQLAYVCVCVCVCV